MKYALFLLVFWSLFPLVGCESGRNPVDGVVVYDFDFDLDPDVDVDLGGGGSGGSGGGGGFGGSPPGTLPPAGSVACNVAELGGLHQLSFFRDARQKKLLELAGFGGLSLDGAANAYVVETSANNEIGLIKYGRQGQPEWERKIGLIEEKLGVGISADPFGGAATFLTQGSEIGGNSDIEITSYDPEGIKKWSRVIQSNMDDVALGSSIDRQRNVLTTGFTLGNLENYVSVTPGGCDYGHFNSNDNISLAEGKNSGWLRLSDNNSTTKNYSVVVNSFFNTRTLSDNDSFFSVTVNNNAYPPQLQVTILANKKNDHGYASLLVDDGEGGSCQKNIDLFVFEVNDDPIKDDDVNSDWHIFAGDNFTCDMAGSLPGDGKCYTNVEDVNDRGFVMNSDPSKVEAYDNLTGPYSDNWSIDFVSKPVDDKQTDDRVNYHITPDGHWWVAPNTNFNGRHYFKFYVRDNDHKESDNPDHWNKGRYCVASVTDESDNSTPILRCQTQLDHTNDDLFTYSINEGDNTTAIIYAHDRNNQPLDFRVLEGTDPGYGSITLSGSAKPVETCFNNGSVHLYNCDSSETVDNRPSHQQYHDYGYAWIDNSTDNTTTWFYRHSMNPNDYSDYPLNSPRNYEFKIRFTDQTGFYNDGRVRITVKAVNDRTIAYDNNTLASEYVENSTGYELYPAPLNVANPLDNWEDMDNSSPEKRNKILLQASDIEDTIDNLTFYAVSSWCERSNCNILEKGSPTPQSNSAYENFAGTNSSNYIYRGKRELHVRPWNNLSYQVYSTNFNFKVRDNGRYGIYHNGSNWVTTDRLDSAKQKISLVLFGLNDQPVADNISVNVSEGVQKTITLRASDEDKEDKISHFTITKLPDPKYGLLRKIDNTSINLGETITATSNQAVIYFNTHDNLSTGLVAVDSFTYTATDNSSTTKSDPRQPDPIYNEPKESDNAMVQLTIYGANDRPTAGAVSDSLIEDAPKGTNLSFSDIDLNDSASYYTLTSLPTYGSINVGGTQLTNSNLPYNLPIGINSVTVSPHQSLAKDQVYSDSFNYTVTDNSSTTILHQETHDNKTSSISTVSLTITGVNDAPVANNADQGNFGYGQANKTFSLTGSDVDGDSISYILNTSPKYTPIASFNPANGAVSLSTHSFSIPNVAFRENLVFQVKDVHNAVSENATVTFDALGPGCVASTFASPGKIMKESVNTDAFLTKYDSEGTLLWSRTISTPTEDVSMGTVTDSLGNTVVSGYTRGELTGSANVGGLDAFLVKFSPSGRELWRQQFGSLGDDVVLALTTDEDGNIYLTGQTSGTLLGHQSTGGTDLFVVKYDTEGRLQWSQQWGAGRHDLGAEISVDVQGQLNLLGLRVSENQNTEVEYFYARLDSSTGDLLLTLPLQTNAPDASGLALDYTGNAFLAQPPSPDLNFNNTPVLEYRPN